MDVGIFLLLVIVTVTVNIKDINDNNLVFEKKIYLETIFEIQEGLILIIRVNDFDIDDILIYSLIGVNDRIYFQITVDGRDGRLEVYTVNEIQIFAYIYRCFLICKYFFRINFFLVLFEMYFCFIYFDYFFFFIEI